MNIVKLESNIVNLERDKLMLNLAHCSNHIPFFLIV